MYYATISELTSWCVLYTPKDNARGRKRFLKCTKVAGSYLETPLPPNRCQQNLKLCMKIEPHYYVNMKLPDRLLKGYIEKCCLRYSSHGTAWSRFCFGLANGISGHFVRIFFLRHYHVFTERYTDNFTEISQKCWCMRMQLVPDRFTLSYAAWVQGLGISNQNWYWKQNS